MRLNLRTIDQFQLWDYCCLQNERNLGDKKEKRHDRANPYHVNARFIERYRSAAD
ncbi:hypothetical protein MES4922_520012 [Mesorhizobium ventifaucium]|uniref:Uncharacterized protein n=1 Tax=Mesorhizobium ventifaucium TaxID=666020 RepID=A0ABM9EBI3_9HYPH|nr:hypothetical protein MES4922_520012 [Mesorhizobium ventifaucium]